MNERDSEKTPILTDNADFLPSFNQNKVTYNSTNRIPVTG